MPCHVRGSCGVERRAGAARSAKSGSTSARCAAALRGAVGASRNGQGSPARRSRSRAGRRARRSCAPRRRDRSRRRGRRPRAAAARPRRRAQSNSVPALDRHRQLHEASSSALAARRHGPSTQPAALQLRRAPRPAAARPAARRRSRRSRRRRRGWAPAATGGAAVSKTRPVMRHRPRHVGPVSLDFQRLGRQHELLHRHVAAALGGQRRPGVLHRDHAAQHPGLHRLAAPRRAA